MSDWIVKKRFTGKLKLKDPILIEGLPGIGNVGKLAADFMIDALKPIHLYDIYSPLFPNSVFISDGNLVELPQVCMHAYKGKNGQDLIILSGDVQPIEEGASYNFCNKILDLVEELGCKEVITLGGIGLHSEVKKPKVYGAATDLKTAKKYKGIDRNLIFNKSKASTIVGAAGLLLGLSQLRKGTGVSLLVETIGHQFHLGLKEAKELLKSINKIFSLEMDLSVLDREIDKVEKIKEQGGDPMEDATLSKSLKRLGGGGGKEDTSYIG